MEAERKPGGKAFQMTGAATWKLHRLIYRTTLQQSKRLATNASARLTA